MGESGVVVDVVGETVQVRLMRTETCAKCGACVAGMTGKEMILSARNACGAVKGDTVAVALGEGVLLSAAMIVYGVPAAFLVGGFILADRLMAVVGWPANDLICFAVGLLLMTAAYWLIAKTEPRLKDKKYEPVAVKIMNGSDM